MAIVCPKCGRQNVDGAQFCAGADCGEYLGWQTRQYRGEPRPTTERAAGSATVRPAAGHTQYASGSVTLSATELAVAPGATTTTTATVYNGGTQVEEFVVSVHGPAGGWATTEPSSLQIYPGDRADCTIRFAPPKHSSTLPGRAEFTVAVGSTLHTVVSVGATGVLEVGEFRALDASLVPQRTSGRGRTVHRIDLTNTGNVVEPVEITATDPTARLRFAVPRGAFAVPPGSQSVDVGVQPPVRWFGRPQQNPFQVTVATAPPTAPMHIDGMREAVPLIAGWVPKLVATIAALALAAGIAFALRPTHPSSVNTAQQSTPATTGAGGSTSTSSGGSPSHSSSPPPPPPPPTMSAVVDVNAHLTEQTGITSVTRPNPGQYEVTTNTDVTGCSYVATIAGPANQLAGGGLVSTATSVANTKAVAVQTMNNDHTPANLPFQLQIQCPGQGMWAVSDDAGNLIRGNGTQSEKLLGLGQYQVTFKTNMRSCSFVATIADPSNQPVANPGVVQVARANNSNAVLVETRDSQGNLMDFPFQLQTRCGNSGQWAVITSSGSISRSHGVNGAINHPTAGVWEVPFNINMGNCSYVASVGIPTNQPVNATPVTPILVFTSPDPNNPNAVLVETQDINRNYVDTPFHVQTACAT